MIGLGQTARTAAPAPGGALEAALRDMLGAGVAVAVTDPRAAPDPLPAPEAAAMLRATAVRRAEFAAGRRAARQAMGALGHAPTPVPPRADRAPDWPDGLVGSIAHTARACAAALAPAAELRAIGIDLEDDADLSPDLVPEICTLAERAWLASQSEGTRGRHARLIFAAKEAAYKCQYPVTGPVMGFDALEVTPDLDTGQFEATFTCDVGAMTAGTCLHGRFARVDGTIACATVLRRSPRWVLQG